MPNPQKIQFKPNAQPEPIGIKGQGTLDAKRNNPYSQVINLVFLKQKKRYPSQNNSQDIAEYSHMEKAARNFHKANKRPPTSDDLERSLHAEPRTSVAASDYFVPNTNINELAENTKEQSEQEFGNLAYNKEGSGNYAKNLAEQAKREKERNNSGQDVSDFSNISEIDLPENLGKQDNLTFPKESSENLDGIKTGGQSGSGSESFKPETRMQFPEQSAKTPAGGREAGSFAGEVPGKTSGAAASGLVNSEKVANAGKAVGSTAKTVESVGQIASSAQKAENLTGGSAVDPLAAADIKGVTETVGKLASGDIGGALKAGGKTLLISAFKLCVNWEFIIFTVGLSIIGALILAPIAAFWFFSDHFGPYEKICLVIALVLDGFLLFLALIGLVATISYMCGYVGGWTGWFASFFSSTAQSAYEFCRSMNFRIP